MRRSVVVEAIAEFGKGMNHGDKIYPLLGHEGAARGSSTLGSNFT
ncbi:hypothetical protein A2U01_0109076, partial [Trifolium medium]|nr:hypothetical protein [Trifolium medium]